MAAADRPDPPRTAAPPPGRWAAVLPVLAVAAAAGVAEGLVDVADVAHPGVRRHAGRLLAYAVVTWVVPAVVVLVPALVLSSLAPAGRRGPAVCSLSLVGLGALCLVLGVDGRVAAILAGPGALIVGWLSLRWPVFLRPTPWVALLAVAGTVGIVGSGRLEAPARAGALPPGPARGPHLLVIVADALRADVLSGYGGPVATPHIDGLCEGEQGWQVPDVLGASSWTLPAVSTLFTATSPRRHGVTGYTSVLGDVPVLADHLARAGFATGAVLSNPILDPERGFTRGFRRVAGDTHPVEGSLFWVRRLHRWLLDTGRLTGPNATRKAVVPVLDGGRLAARRTGTMAADEVTDTALQLAREAGDARQFLYVHYFDPHDPYLLHPTPLSDHEPEFVPLERERMLERYHGEVAFLDEHVGRLVAGLRSEVGGEWLVVFTADHGEEFLDHGDFGHHATLYDELVRLPLLFSFPDGLEVGPAPEAAALADVTPTILGALDLPPLPGAGGRDLGQGAGAGQPMTGGADGDVSSGTGPAVPPRIAERIEEDVWLVAIRFAGEEPPTHWIGRRPRAASGELAERVQWEGFDLRADPRQQSPLLPDPDRRGVLEQLLAEYLATGGEAEQVPLDEDDLQRLRELGYIR